MARTVDITPTWIGLLSLLLEVQSHGATPEGRRQAREELQRMAQAADAWNAHCKAEAEAKGAA